MRPARDKLEILCICIALQSGIKQPWSETQVSISGQIELQVRLKESVVIRNN